MMFNDVSCVSNGEGKKLPFLLTAEFLGPGDLRNAIASYAKSLDLFSEKSPEVRATSFVM